MLAKISVFPIDKGESVGNYVAKVIDYIIRESDKAGVRYEITSMGTLIEGETEDVWRLLKGSHEVMRKYSNRVYITIEIDDRRGKTDAIT
nr:MTH1187 family thiamine-binding protein [Candidatus Aenigmarchaeota archaeon]NIQ17733.1 MTH1187 family thiamine-binding protein [Candidatus Aenigmarchaeota archaeon]NIS73045.1 MTH1187 family thiamine-binding protein [Candidatus Aenigmarchaeota archaeon]